jgi:hypothetical protein
MKIDIKILDQIVNDRGDIPSRGVTVLSKYDSSILDNDVAYYSIDPGNGEGPLGHPFKRITISEYLIYLREQKLKTILK